MHLPQLDLDGSGLSYARLHATVVAARELGLVAVGANDHLRFTREWLDGPTALAAVAGAAGELELVTTIANPVLRQPVVLARTLRSLQRLAAGRVVAGVGPGSSAADHAAVGLDFADRWRAFDRALDVLVDELSGPGALPVWVASWGSRAGMRRVARRGEGWLASAYNTSPAQLATALSSLPAGFPHALVTMWTWVTESSEGQRRVLEDLLGPMLGRDPAALADRLLVGPASYCTELLASYAEAGCRRVHVWPLGDEPAQLRRLVEDVVPRLPGG